MTKYYVNGKRYNTPYQIIKEKLVKFMKMCLWIIVLTSIVVGIFEAGSYLNPAKIVLPPTQVIKEVPAQAPILDRIAKCESGGNHYGPSGQVLMTGNTNKTVDVGKYAINSVWFKKATELGLDITKEEDNKKMAEWIYQNRGTGDWSASSKCWNR